MSYSYSYFVFRFSMYTLTLLLMRMLFLSCYRAFVIEDVILVIVIVLLLTVNTSFIIIWKICNFLFSRIYHQNQRADKRKAQKVKIWNFEPLKMCELVYQNLVISETGAYIFLLSREKNPLEIIVFTDLEVRVGAEPS